MPCRICGGEQYEAEPHETEEHTEAWVGMADAVETGEVLYMPVALIFDALDAMEVHHTLNETTRGLVDRRIVQAIVDSIRDQGIDENTQELADDIQKHLDAHPLRSLDEV